MNQIGILFQEKSSQAGQLAGEIIDWLAEQNVTGWASSAWAGEELAAKLAGSSLLVVLGGDGSILRAARLAAPLDLPLFGINMGRVGFLTEADPATWPEKLAQVLAGQCWWEKRMMLRAQLMRGAEQIAELVALNDVVVGRGPQARVVRIRLGIDSNHITTYTADALIAATPTGSTAYSLAAGGPLLPPELQNFLIIPVAPHLSFERPLVLHREAVVTIEMEEGHEGLVTADGQDVIALQDGDRLVIGEHEYLSRFARLEKSSYFYHRLMERLGLGILRR